MPFLDNYDLVLLDQGRTFMFDLDRFGPDEDYHATYSAIGGTDLSPDRVSHLVRNTLDRIRVAYEDPDSFEAVPTTSDALAEIDASLTDTDRHHLGEVIGAHEVGSISRAHAEILRRLAETHSLGIVSNVWADSRHFEANLGRRDLLDCFTHRVWSSDHGCVKPSHRLFRIALDRFGVSPDRAVYVGDDPMRDVEPAKTLGMGAVWIDHGTTSSPNKDPDRTIHDLVELLDV